jgi:hypothetical protein
MLFSGNEQYKGFENTSAHLCQPNILKPLRQLSKATTRLPGGSLTAQSPCLQQSRFIDKALRRVLLPRNSGAYCM